MDSWYRWEKSSLRGYGGTTRYYIDEVDWQRKRSQIFRCRLVKAEPEHMFRDKAKNVFRSM